MSKPKTSIICEHCNKSVEIDQRSYNRGQRFCSLSCSSSRKRRQSYQPNSTCAWCEVKFYRQKSHTKSKSGLLFCCREHKDLAQRIGGIKDIQPKHYSEEVKDYRSKISKDKCYRCGYSEVPEILQVHHIDRDRNNNSIENLICLCPNCHMADHFSDKTGIWAGVK